MIMVTRLNGESMALNPDLVERAETTPDTVVTLVNGNRYVIAESLGDLIALIRDYRVQVAALALHGPAPLAEGPPGPHHGRSTGPGPRPPLAVLPDRT